MNLIYIHLLLSIINPWGIHGAGIYTNIKEVYWWDPWSTIYSSTMDPMGYKGDLMTTYYTEYLWILEYWICSYFRKYREAVGVAKPLFRFLDRLSRSLTFSVQITWLFLLRVAAGNLLTAKADVGRKCQKASGIMKRGEFPDDFRKQHLESGCPCHIWIPWSKSNMAGKSSTNT